MISLKDVFLYIRPLWENRQHEISLRAVLAISLTIDFIWHGAGRSDAALQTEAILIAGLLGLTMFQNIQDRKTEADIEKTVIKAKTGSDQDPNDPDIQVNTVNIKK